MKRNYTRELLALKAKGLTICCSIGPRTAVEYQPRTGNDPQPWRDPHTNFRYTGRQCHARDAQGQWVPSANDVKIRKAAERKDAMTAPYLHAKSKVGPGEAAQAFAAWYVDNEKGSTPKDMARAFEEWYAAEVKKLVR